MTAIYATGNPHFDEQVPSGDDGEFMLIVGEDSWEGKYDYGPDLLRKFKDALPHFLKAQKRVASLRKSV